MGMKEPRTRKIYNIQSYFYDQLAGSMIRRRQCSAISRMNIQPGEKVLDIGIGTGVSLEQYPQHCHVVGIDISEGMLGKAHERIVKEELKHASLVRADAMFMPFDAYSRCGGLSTDYFMYYEELDLAARLRALGLALGWCRQSLIAHAGGATTGSYRLRRARPPAVAYHSMRSAVVYTRRHKPSAVPTVIISRVLAHVCLNAVLGDVHAALAAARGCAAGLTARLREGP